MCNTWYVCMLSCFSCVQLFATLRTVTHQAPLSMEFPRQEYWNVLPFPPPRYLPNLVIAPTSLAFLVLAGGVFTTGPPVSAYTFSNPISSWVGRLPVVQMSALPSLIYRCNAIPIKGPASYFVDSNTRILKCIWWDPQKICWQNIPKTNIELKERNKIRGLTVVLEIQSDWFWLPVPVLCFLASFGFAFV